MKATEAKKIAFSSKRFQKSLNPYYTIRSVSVKIREKALQGYGTAFFFCTQKEYPTFAKYFKRQGYRVAEEWSKGPMDTSDFSGIRIYWE